MFVVPTELEEVMFRRRDRWKTRFSSGVATVDAIASGWLQVARLDTRIVGYSTSGRLLTAGKSSSGDRIQQSPAIKSVVVVARRMKKSVKR